MRLLVIHGPSLNLLGTREPQIYGNKTLDDINHEISEAAAQHSIDVRFLQSNDEGEIIHAIHNARNDADFIVINPGAYSHYSHAIADAITAAGVRAIEVHLTNIFAREPFRRRSVVSGACVGSIVGFGSFSYVLAVRAAAQLASR